MSNKPLYNNSLLTSLSRDDLAVLQPYLEPVDLRLKQVLEEPGKPIRHVYFLEGGLASVIANGPGAGRIEVCLIGREGMTGLVILMLKDRTPLETVMQVGGSGQRIAAELLTRAVEESKSLRLNLLNYAHRFTVQMAHTALANARHKVEERLARWLLMAHDRLGRDDLPLTHELLSVILGVRRTGVTEAVQMLEGAHLIIAKRGAITIRDREGLKRSARGAYQPVQDEIDPAAGLPSTEGDRTL
jgi:CRP-like cAMP-binding protein